MIELLDRAKAITLSDAATARYLGIPRSMISKIRHGEKPMPPLQAGRLAQLLEENPAAAVFKALEEQATKKGEAAQWRKWSKSLGQIAAVVVAAAGLNFAYYNTSQASNFRTTDASLKSDGIFNASHSLRALTQRIPNQREYFSK